MMVCTIACLLGRPSGPGSSRCAITGTTRLVYSHKNTSILEWFCRSLMAVARGQFSLSAAFAAVFPGVLSLSFWRRSGVGLEPAGADYFGVGAVGWGDA